MKYLLEGTIWEAIDTYVRISLGNGLVRCTKHECPSSAEVLVLLEDMQGYGANSAQRTNCSRAAHDARDNKKEWELVL